MEKKLLLIIFSGLIYCGVYAQANIQLYNVSISDSSNTLVIRALAKNNGNDTSLNLYLNIGIINGNSTNGDVNIVQKVYSGNPFPHGTTTTEYVKSTIAMSDPLLNTSGTNIIVIWPTGAGNVAKPINRVGTNDTLKFLLPLGIAPMLNYDNFVKISPNPFTDHINIEKKNPALHIARISLFDISGKQVLVKNEDVSVLPISGLQKGLYFMDILYTDGNRSRFKVMGM